MGSGRTGVSGNGVTRSILTISNVHLTDAGVYVCSRHSNGVYEEVRADLVVIGELLSLLPQRHRVYIPPFVQMTRSCWMPHQSKASSVVQMQWYSARPILATLLQLCCGSKMAAQSIPPQAHGSQWTAMGYTFKMLACRTEESTAVSWRGWGGAHN